MLAPFRGGQALDRDDGRNAKGIAMADHSFKVGQRVRVILNERNRTARTGTIRQIIWHYKDQSYNYYLDVNGKKISKRYYEEDIEQLPLEQ